MLQNYFKIALRNLFHHKMYSFISILGLAIGITCTILIILWVQDELSFDRFHKKASQIYRLVVESNNIKYAVSHAPLGEALKNEYPEIISATRVDLNTEKNLIKYGEKKFEQVGKFVDPDFFEIFNFPLIEGDLDINNPDPYLIIITKNLADKCFANQNPIGEILNVDNGDDYKVTAVIEDIPPNSHIKFDFLRLFQDEASNWNDWSYYTYILVQDNSTIEQVTKKINTCFKKHKPKTTSIYYLQPLTQIHLNSDFKLDVWGNGNIQYVYIFISIAIYIFIIACFNFMNISTASSMVRAKEIGLRKVVGSSRIQIIKQFLGESIFLAIIAFIVALFLVELFIPFFTNLSGKSLKIDYLDFRFIISSIFLIIVTGTFAGSYPAFLLSTFSPLNTLKETWKRMEIGASKFNFRKILVVSQFTLSIGLIIGTLIIIKQLDFIKNANLGFDKENLIYLELRHLSISKTEAMKNDLLQNPNILSVTASEYLPAGQIMSGTDDANWEGKIEGEKIHIQVNSVDVDYLKTYRMQMSLGRFFSKDFSTDMAKGVILNETAIKAMRIESPIGKKFEYYWGPDSRIVGVIKDFHYKPFHQEIEPLIIRLSTDSFTYLTIRIKPLHSSNFDELIKYLQNSWKKYMPDYPFEFHFINERIESLYTAERRMSKIFNYFTSIAILIACLGLFGLSSNTIERRTKEIGIRKVVGASVQDILVMLIKHFTLCVLLANIFAWPIGWYTMNKWLQNFAYRIDLTIWPFLLAGGIALIIALLTVGWQAAHAAIANPVQSLRYE